jgi:outer membrane protein OmpA-like peptidoglycan-associated protein
MASTTFPAGWRIARGSWPGLIGLLLPFAVAAPAMAQATTYIGGGGGSGVSVDLGALDRLGPRTAPLPGTLLLPLPSEGTVILVVPGTETPPLPSPTPTLAVPPQPTAAAAAIPAPPPPPPPPEPALAAALAPPPEPVPAQPLPGAEPVAEATTLVEPEPPPQAVAEPEPPVEPEPEATAVASAPTGVPDLTRAGVLYSLPFPAGETTLRPEAAAALDALVAAMAADATARVQLVAYAGAGASGGSAARRLSLSRALAVRAYLIERGVRSTRIDVRALGAKSDGGPPDRVDVVALPR